MCDQYLYIKGTEETHEPKGEGIYEENENSSSANNGSKDANNVKGMFRMFYCSGVEYLDLSNWNLGNAEYLEDFIAGCYHLEKIEMPINLKQNIEFGYSNYKQV